MLTTLNKNNQKTLEMFLQNNLVIDNHPLQDPKYVYALVEFEDNERDLGACFENCNYSINAVYISEKDEKLHLSEMSIGGVLYGTPTKESIEQYNAHQFFDYFKIRNLIKADGTVISFDTKTKKS